MEVVFAKFDAIVVTPDGGRHTVGFGQHWAADDAVVRARPDVFSPDSRYGALFSGTPPAEMAEPPVEQATAGPGEKRATRRGVGA